MSIQTGMEYMSVYKASQQYLVARASILPLHGKKPALANWKQYQKRVADYKELDHWKALGILQNVGIILGAVSSNLIVIDLDGLDAVAKFEAKFPQWLNTLTVLTGSQEGKHFYYYVEDLPPSIRYNGYEIRANGCYVVAPPSLHPDTAMPYRVEKDCKPLVVSHIGDIYRWIKAMQPKPANPQNVNQAIFFGDRWAQGALTGECARVRNSTDGNANNNLNLAAFLLGRIIAEGRLHRSDVERALYNAASQLTARDGESATLRTIKSGLDAGIANPRRTKV